MCLTRMHRRAGSSTPTSDLADCCWIKPSARLRDDRLSLFLLGLRQLLYGYVCMCWAEKQQ